jgi:DNA-binding transcriptional LysR family regulator
MDVNLMQVRAFLAVSRLRSFTAAASALHISQPALTVQVQQLEEWLNLRLLDRDTRHVTLTAAGRELAPRLQRIMAEFEAVTHDAKHLADKLHGVVRLACVPSVATTYLPDAILRFRTEYPRISFDLRDLSGRRVIASVRSEDVEFGITNVDEKWPDLESIDLCQEEIHVVFPTSHPIARLDEVTLEQIAEYPLVLLDTELNSRTLLDAALAASGRLAKPACEVKYTSSAIGMVRAGLGIALLGSFVVSANHIYAHPELESRRINTAGFALIIRLIKKKGRSISPSAQAFIDLLLKVKWEDHKQATQTL